MAVNPLINASMIFSKIKEAKMRQSANYIRPGHYLLRMDAIKLDKTRKEQVFMAVEMTVLKVLDSDSGRGHSVGESICHMMMVANDSFLGNLKAMIAHLMDMQPEAIEEKDCMDIVAPDQPLTGSVIEILARNINTKAGKPFTVVDYKREVPPLEATQVLDAEVQKLYFPNDALTRMAQAQQAAATKAA